MNHHDIFEIVIGSRDISESGWQDSESQLTCPAVNTPLCGLIDLKPQNIQTVLGQGGIGDGDPTRLGGLGEAWISADEFN